MYNKDGLPLGFHAVMLEVDCLHRRRGKLSSLEVRNFLKKRCYGHQDQARQKRAKRTD